MIRIVLVHARNSYYNDLTLLGFTKGISPFDVVVPLSNSVVLSDSMFHQCSPHSLKLAPLVTDSPAFRPTLNETLAFPVISLLVQTTFNSRALETEPSNLLKYLIPTNMLYVMITTMYRNKKETTCVTGD